LVSIGDIISFLGGGLHSACTSYNMPDQTCVPLSTLSVFGAALLLSLVAMSANRFLVDYKMIARVRQEYMAFMKAMNKARKDGDEKQLDKLMKRSPSMQKMQFRATLEQMKTYPITIGPFYLIYAILGFALTSTHAIAYVPFAIPFAAILGNPSNPGSVAVLSLFFWYLICSFAISVPLTRIFGVASAFSMASPTGDSK
jgi:uncharacterized membrane protein (DUF106 family)